MKPKYVTLLLSFVLAMNGILPIYASDNCKEMWAAEAGVTFQDVEGISLVKAPEEISASEAPDEAASEETTEVSDEVLEDVDFQSYMHPTTWILFTEMMEISNKANVVFDYLASHMEQEEEEDTEVVEVEEAQEVEAEEIEAGVEEVAEEVEAEATEEVGVEGLETAEESEEESEEETAEETEGEAEAASGTENAAFQVLEDDIAGLEGALLAVELGTEELQAVKASWEEVKKEIQQDLEATDEDGIYDLWEAQDEEEALEEEEEDLVEEDSEEATHSEEDEEEDSEDIQEDEVSFEEHPLYEEAESVFMQMSYDDRLKYLDCYVAVYEAGMNAIVQHIRSNKLLGKSIGKTIDAIADQKAEKKETLQSLKDIYHLTQGYVWKKEQYKALVDAVDDISMRKRVVGASALGVYQVITLLQKTFSWLK